MKPLPSIFSTVRKAVTKYSARARGCQLFLLLYNSLISAAAAQADKCLAASRSQRTMSSAYSTLSAPGRGAAWGASRQT